LKFKKNGKSMPLRRLPFCGFGCWIAICHSVAERSGKEQKKNWEKSQQQQPYFDWEI